ncbi:class I SAM-dependent methyltransferase [Guyparkeria hydrothermalis]|uniref:class I SAM-dependent methyltransferase n=1 Tax=Guyparkeria hydrothermalis TaxID=923 RepID=UPI0020216ADD|nr:class I SAM-dependent methyltransferase [Guyparkeria hydrothermalis]MCL7743343.1 class I SAM-dependent methyltransferase [Guyparkeria hydrothermalis]
MDCPLSNHFESGGNAYARHRPDYPSELVDTLSAACRGNVLAVDVGSGTGQLTATLTNHFERVIGIDPSINQLRNAVQHPRIEYRQGPAEALPVADDSADLVVTAQAAHWFDLDRFYSETRRILRPGGAVALVSYGVPYIESGANSAFQRFYWQELPAFWPKERHHVETGYADLPFPFEEFDTPKLYIRKAWNLSDFLGYLDTWSAKKRAVALGHENLFKSFAETLQRDWGEPDVAHGIVWPLTVRAGRV